MRVVEGQAGGEAGVQGMAGLVGMDSSDNGMATQGNVPDQVQGFVADKLIAGS